MADFCNKCSNEMFGEEVLPDIDVFKEFESLSPGYCSSGFICEGCGLTVIGKMEDGSLKVMRLKEDEDESAVSFWEEY